MSVSASYSFRCRECGAIFQSEPLSYEVLEKGEGSVKCSECMNPQIVQLPSLFYDEKSENMKENHKILSLLLQPLSALVDAESLSKTEESLSKAEGLLLTAVNNPIHDIRLAWLYMMDQLMDFDKERPRRILRRILDDPDPDPLSFKTCIQFLTHSSFREDEGLENLRQEFFRKYSSMGWKDEEVLRLNESFPRSDD